MDDDSTAALRRRVRLILLMQRGPIDRFVAAEALGTTDKTVQRDLEWMREHGVPIEREQASSQAPAVWSVKRRWSAAKWLWEMMSGSG